MPARPTTVPPAGRRRWTVTIDDRGVVARTVLLRPGEALVVHRSGSRHLVVTVDDVRRDAALLSTLVERSRRSAG